MTARPTAIVTGGNTGIGFQTALQLARKGYTVIIAVRNLQLGHDAAAAINASARDSGGEAVVMFMDNSRLQTVREFARDFIAKHRYLHCLVCNAGISGFGITKETRTTPDGYQLLFQVNFLAAYLLTTLLLPRIKQTAIDCPVAPCRVVLLSSVTHRLVSPPADWAPLLKSPKGYSSSYALSKLACMLYAYWLQRTLAEEGCRNVLAIAVNPGAVRSDIWRDLSPATGCWFRPFMRLFFLSTEQGCATSVAAASAGEVSGKLLVPGRPWYLTPYAIPSVFQNDRYILELPSLACDALAPFFGARVCRSTSASYDPRSARALVATCAEAITRALDNS